MEAHIAQMREHLSGYLAGDISLDTFLEWFIPATWNAHRFDSAARDFAYEIEGAFTEYQCEELTEKELRETLAALV